MISIGYSNKNMIYSLAPFTDYYRDYTDTFNMMINGGKVTHTLEFVYNIIHGIETYPQYKINPVNLSTAESVYIATNLFSTEVNVDDEIRNIDSFMYSISNDLMIRLFKFDHEFTFNKGGDIDKKSNHFRIMIDSSIKDKKEIKLLSIFIDNSEEDYFADIVDAVIVSILVASNQSHNIPIIKIDDCKLCLNIYDCQDIVAFMFISNYIRVLDSIYSKITGTRIPNITEFVVDVLSFENKNTRKIHEKVMNRLFDSLEGTMTESKLIELYNKFIFL